MRAQPTFSGLPTSMASVKAWKSSLVEPRTDRPDNGRLIFPPHADLMLTRRTIFTQLAS
jgi:hypothetical protein